MKDLSTHWKDFHVKIIASTLYLIRRTCVEHVPSCLCGEAMVIKKPNLILNETDLTEICKENLFFVYLPFEQLKV